jgi:ATP-dependent DNA helicase RecQ
LNYFNEEASDNCGSCDVCLTELEMMDATRPAQMVLSAMVRLQSSFGMNYIVQVLRGSKAENIWDSHKSLKTYGAGVEHSKEDWTYMIKEFIREGYINRSHGQYPVLELNEKSWKVLKEGEKVSIAKPEVETVNREQHEEQEALPFESDLLQDLKRLRKKIADEMGVPSFVVFSDATVLELATYLPQKEEDLYKISGFGEVKVDKYGFSFLEEINAYCRIHKLESRIDQKASVKRKTTKKKRKKKSSGSSDTKLRSFELHEQGMSMLEIAKNRDLNAVTIEGHLAHFVGEGKLSVHDFVTPEKRKPIEDAIEKLGAEKLAPLKEALGDSFSYGEIKMTVKHLEFLESKK